MDKNKLIEHINSALQQQIVQKFSVVAVGFLVVGSVAFFGTHQNQGSHASTGAALTVSPAAGTFVAGTTVDVTLYVDSENNLVNSVQASLAYDASKLQFVPAATITGVAEGTAFPTVLATSTGTPGLIRIARTAKNDTSISGNNAVVRVTFKILDSAGPSSLKFDPAFSYVVRATDNVNILATTSGASYLLKLPVPTLASLSPATGSIRGRTLFNLAGTGFVNGATVTIGGTPASNVIVRSPTSITADVAVSVKGIVVVTNPDGQSTGGTAVFLQ